MAIQIGGDTKLQVNTGTVGSPTWTNVGFEVTSSLNIELDTVDANTKGNNGWGSQISTLRRWSGSVDGKLDRSDNGVVYLEDAAMNKTQLHVRFNISNSAGGAGDGTFTGFAWTSSHGYTFDVSDVAGFSTAFAGDGELIKA
jgi:hypothetical protein